MCERETGTPFSMNMICDNEKCEPTRGYPTDAGLDLKCANDVVITKGGSAEIHTGVRFEIPEGYYGKLESKSGLNFKHSIVCLGGVIDSSYRGEIIVKLYNFGDKDVILSKGSKCVQIIFMKHYNPILTKIEQFAEDTDRGENGFGSTGK